MILKGPKFYTIKGAFDDLVLWVDKDREFPDPIEDKEIEISDSTEEEKCYWLQSMERIDGKVKNNFMGVSLRDFEKWKNKKKQIKWKC
jgi:hypothetical protein